MNKFVVDAYKRPKLVPSGRFVVDQDGRKIGEVFQLGVSAAAADALQSRIVNSYNGLTDLVGVLLRADKQGGLWEALFKEGITDAYDTALSAAVIALGDAGVADVAHRYELDAGEILAKVCTDVAKSNESTFGPLLATVVEGLQDFFPNLSEYIGLLVKRLESSFELSGDVQSDYNRLRDVVEKEAETLNLRGSFEENGKVVSVTLDVKVHRSGTFRQVAYQQALQDGMNEEEASEFLDPEDKALGECAVMILDPGVSPAGSEILGSSHY